MALLGIVVAVALWWAATRVIPMPEQFARGFAPASAFEALWQIAISGELLHHLLPSLRRIGIGLLVAFLVGVPTGIAIGYFAAARQLTNVVFQFLRMISPLAWMPVAIIVFGVGDSPVYFLIAIAAVWPIVINTAQGVRGVEPGWIRVVRTLGGGQWDVLRRAIMPAVVPDIITGLRISMGISWVILVPAEMLGVSSGLGYFILDTRDRFAYGELMACILVIGAIGLVLDVALGYVEGLLSWKAEQPAAEG
jgi:NitT/TauT family transport system permease protein